MWKAATALAKAWQLQDWFFFYKLVHCQACPDRSVPGSSTSLPSKLLIPSHLPSQKRAYSPQKAMRHLITYHQQVCCNVAASLGEFKVAGHGVIGCMAMAGISVFVDLLYLAPFIHVFQAFSDEIIHRWYHFGEQYCLPEAPCVACLGVMVLSD